MKICEYCRTKYADDVLQCNSCGAKEFKSICNSCGQILDGKECPDCKEELSEKLYGYSDSQINPAEVLDQFVITIPSKKRRKVKRRINWRIIVLLLIFLPGVMRFLTETPEDTLHNDVSGEAKVVDANLTISGEDEFLLMTKDELSGKVITDIMIDFSDIENKQEIQLAEVLPFIGGYIPYDIIDTYYIFEESFHEIHKEEPYEAYYYTMVLNDIGQSAYESGEQDLINKIGIRIVHKDEDWIANIGLLSDEGEHKLHPELYDVQDWAIDIHEFNGLNAGN